MFVCLLAYCFRRLINESYAVEKSDAQRRVERDNDMAHRPIECLDDELSTVHQDAISEYIWLTHKKRITKNLQRLRFGLPLPRYS